MFVQNRTLIQEKMSQREAESVYVSVADYADNRFSVLCLIGFVFHRVS